MQLFYHILFHTLFDHVQLTLIVILIYLFVYCGGRGVYTNTYTPTKLVHLLVLRVGNEHFYPALLVMALQRWRKR